ncbi:MAG: 16S rRNA (cytosine(1402)-N(4))-methyltransferase RsmH [Gammaproteobacteria bacterium]|jgi:16S rRNA (cytosine1402-N4)-methyltransferase
MNSDNKQHAPVLLQEAIEGLNIKPSGIYIDGTFGRGGHAKLILEKLSADGQLIVIDKDPEAIMIAEKMLAKDRRCHIYHGSFNEIDKLAKQLNIVGKVCGILLDLGVSSPQLEDETRGFSFLRDGPLDMRMDLTHGIDAATWINRVNETVLMQVLKDYGEEKFARRIANAIIKARNSTPIETTKQLADIVAKANPAREKHKHPATRSFQAIRIFINQELEELQSCLDKALDILAIGGRLVVISFHSLEDRIVKRFIQKHATGDYFPIDVPIKHENLKPRLKKFGRAIKPTNEELKANRRARSAKLRIAEKLL